ncbi:uncharacterized protein cep295 isoform X2 [Phyllopteryx taeniolatus]|uniref:uncharacterized protein cep295 isoform X2 n=1 Tax=Phyllopteryx taeniolatus TaxID=161469 RepID=UPI002AD5804B|nr:uncharacterized protein cep295 isoform X2 [Phyllopteryx taeniolatus]
MARRLGKLRLSPNEEAQLIQEERERRRKLRIQQVREQQKDFALQTRQNVEQRRRRELELLGQGLREEWEQQRSEKLHMLQMLYEQSLQMVGHGQRMAKENEPDLAALAQREAQNHAKAEERFREALKELKSQRLKDIETQSRTINARKKALQVEKDRSAKVANLPVPTPKPILATDSEKLHVGKKSDVSAFAFTRYHMTAATVDRAVDTQLTDAHEGAELEMKRLQDFQRDDERKRAERMETARLRGKSAMRKEHLALDRDRLLVELEHMQQADMLRRRQQAFQMPPQIFQPPHLRQEMKDDFQRDMEFAFEDMYTRERKIKGDLMGRLVSEPLPDTSTISQDPELDVMLEETNTSEIDKSQVDPESQDSACVDTVRAAPRQALKKLLSRIRNQRSDNGVPAARSLVTVASRVSERDTDVIPERDTIVRPGGVAERDAVADSEALSERDMTIDTGSLSSQPTQPPSSSTAKPISQLIPADAQHQDDLSSKILELEMERKKRELELEREKQQQMALLKELEEEKAQLERLLNDIQQEGNHPKVTVAQEIALKQAEVPPVHDQDVPRGRELLTPEHTRRIRECQERLLEQNRINQQSMEVARRHLEKYQHALQVHRNAASAPPPLPQLPSVEPQIAMEVTSQGSAAPTFLSSLPSPSFSRSSSLLPAEPFGRSNLPVHQIQGVSDLAPLRQNLVSRVAERARSPTGTIESLPSKAVIRKVCPPKGVTREVLPPEAVTREVLPPEAVTREVLPPEAVTRGILPPEGVTRGILPPEAVTRGILPPEAVTKGILPPEAVTREVFPPEAVTREPIPAAAVTREPFPPDVVATELFPQVVTREPLSPKIFTREPILPQVIATESIPPQLVTRESLHPKPVTREVLPPQAVTKESFALKPVTTDFLPFKAITTSLPFQPIQTVTLGRPPLPRLPLAGTLADDYSDRQRPQEVYERQREGEVESFEELRLQQRESLELLRQQKETLKALINVDAQVRPHSEVSAPDDAGQTRSELLSSLLKVIEKSNKGSLSHARHLQVEDVPSLQLPSTSRAASLHAPARAAKPPVTRIRLGTMMREQHELSAIQEVETPVDTSQVTGPEDVFAVPQHTMDWSLQEPCDFSLATEQALQTPSMSSSKRSSPALCGDKLLMRTGTSPDSSQHGSYDPLSSDFGRGADCVGPTLMIHSSLRDDSRPPGEASQQYAHRPPDPECLSTTTLSTGSYSKSDPEPNAGKSPNLVTMETSRVGNSSSPAAAQHHSALLASLFNDGNVQRIIDRFAKELDSSLSTADKSTDSVSSVLEEPNSSFSEQSLYKISGRRGEDDEASHVTLPPPPVHSALLASLFNDGNVQHVIDRFAKELDCSQSAAGKSTDSEGSVLEDPHSSLTEQSLQQVSGRREDDDESSRVTLPSQATHISDLTIHPMMEQLSVCEDQDSFRPLMAQLADQSSTLLADHRDATMERLVDQPSAQSSMIGQLPVPPPSAGWDLTLSRIMEEVSRESSQRWRRGEREPCVGQLMSRAEQSWLDESQEDSSMRPLVGELDVSSGQDSGTSGERMRVDLGAAMQATVPPYQSLPTEASHHRTSDSRPNPLPPLPFGEDSFLPLPPEVTCDETIDPSAVFRNAPNSSDGHLSSGELSMSALSNSQSHDGTSESERSTECFRAEDGSHRISAWHCVSSPQVVELSQSDVRDVLSPFSVLPEEDVEEQNEVRVPVPDLSAKVQPEQSLNLRMDFTSKLLEAGSTKGILEQSQITLVSSTDTTLQDNFLSVVEPLWEEEGQKVQEASQTTIMEESSGSSKEEQSPTHAAMLLEFNWGSWQQGVFEQKRRALQQRSARRAEEVKAQGALARTGVAEVKVAAQSEERPPRTRRDAQLDTFKTAKSTLVKQQKTPTPPAVTMSTRLNNQSQVKKSKHDVLEMHKRTQRLYEQLEEVKQQKAVRSRKEAYANNRQKAKAFHMKTLQKLRAKQTQQ